MSEIYEAVVVLAKADAVAAALASSTASLRLRVTPLSASLTGVHRIASRNEPLQAEAIHALAARLSVLGSSAALLYDNRVGLRSAVLFERGAPLREYGPDTERWVPLDEQGLPIQSAPPVLLKDLQPPEEYEVIASAIDQALTDLLGPEPHVSAATLNAVFTAC